MKAVVLGGGFAGLAAGVALAERGVDVTVCEAKNRLGGRAYSFHDAQSGTVVDNGQHAMMGCYTATLDFLRRIGAADKIVRQPNLRVDMVHPQLGAGAIACPGWPSPLHMLAGIARYRLLSKRERALALYAGGQLMLMRRRKDARLRTQTVTQVLIALRQSPHARQCFWDPVVVATLNELSDRACAAPFVEVLARAFFASRADSQFVLPKVGLSDLYVGDATRVIERAGGRVETGAQATGLVVRDDQVTGVTLRDGRTVEADACISTLPPRALAPILPPALAETAPLRDVARLDASPIVSTHLWLDRPVLGGDFVGLLGTTTQWAFNRTRLTGEGAGEGEFVSAVISAGRDVVAWDGDRVAGQVMDDLRTLLPAARTAMVRRAIVVKEKHATMSVTPEAEALRPGPVTPLRRFLLAGDWTATGLPATIESAVLSGERAAGLAHQSALC